MEYKKNIVLIGMMGSGKSTIGRMLARKLNLNFIDIDSKIEKLENLKIKDIFEKKGEIFFRNLEFKESFKEIKKNNNIVSLGGGAYLNDKLRLIIKKFSCSIWLHWKSKTLIERIRNNPKRPVIRGMNEFQIKKMINERNKVYAKSDFKITCDKHKKNEIIDKIINVYKKYEISN